MVRTCLGNPLFDHCVENQAQLAAKFSAENSNPEFQISKFQNFPFVINYFGSLVKARFPVQQGRRFESRIYRSMVSATTEK